MAGIAHYILRAGGPSQGSGYFDPTMSSVPLDISHAMA
jgi:hypothetical protein